MDIPQQNLDIIDGVLKGMAEEAEKKREKAEKVKEARKKAESLARKKENEEFEKLLKLEDAPDETERSESIDGQEILQYEWHRPKQAYTIHDLEEDLPTKKLAYADLLDIRARGVFHFMAPEKGWKANPQTGKVDRLPQGRRSFEQNLYFSRHVKQMLNSLNAEENYYIIYNMLTKVDCQRILKGMTKIVEGRPTKFKELVTTFKNRTIAYYKKAEEVQRKVTVKKEGNVKKGAPNILKKPKAKRNMPAEEKAFGEPVMKRQTMRVDSNNDTSIPERSESTVEESSVTFPPDDTGIPVERSESTVEKEYTPVEGEESSVTFPSEGPGVTFPSNGPPDGDFGYDPYVNHPAPGEEFSDDGKIQRKNVYFPQYNAFSNPSPTHALCKIADDDHVKLTKVPVTSWCSGQFIADYLLVDNAPQYMKAHEVVVDRKKVILLSEEEVAKIFDDMGKRPNSILYLRDALLDVFRKNLRDKQDDVLMHDLQKSKGPYRMNWPSAIDHRKFGLPTPLVEEETNMCRCRCYCIHEDIFITQHCAFVKCVNMRTRFVYIVVWTRNAAGFWRAHGHYSAANIIQKITCAAEMAAKVVEELRKTSLLIERHYTVDSGPAHWVYCRILPTMSAEGGKVDWSIKITAYKSENRIFQSRPLASQISVDPPCRPYLHFSGEELKACIDKICMWPSRMPTDNRNEYLTPK